MEWCNLPPSVFCCGNGCGPHYCADDGGLARNCCRYFTLPRSACAKSGAPTRSCGLTSRSHAAPTWSASFPTTRRFRGWWAASCWSSGRNGSWSAAASLPKQPWPASRSLKRPWSLSIVIVSPAGTKHQLKLRGVNYVGWLA